MTTIAHERTHHQINAQTRELNWEIQAWKPILAATAIITVPVLFFMLIIGGILFWMPHISLPGTAHAEANMSQLEEAQNGIGTMKKMIGNNAAWSTAITQEYQRLNGTNTSTTCVDGQ